MFGGFGDNWQDIFSPRRCVRKERVETNTQSLQLWC